MTIKSQHMCFGIVILMVCTGFDAQMWKPTGETLARSLEAASWKEGAPTLIYEGWPEFAFESEVEGKSEMAVLNKDPNVKHVGPPPSDANFKGVLNHIVRQHGGVTVLEDSSSSTVFVIRKELLKNPRWPINLSFEEASTATLTLAQAKELLHSKYGLNLGPAERFIGVTGKETETIVWDAPANAKLNRPAIVRDLLASIVTKFYKPKSVAMVIALTVQGKDKEADAAGAKAFRWSLAY